MTGCACNKRNHVKLRKETGHGHNDRNYLEMKEG